MGAVWLRARADLRAGWRASLALALLVALASGSVIAAAAGARRTASVYERFHDANAAADALFFDDGDAYSPGLDLAEVERLPQVETFARALLTYVAEDSLLIAPEDGSYGRSMSRLRILEGRAPRQAEPGEVVVSFPEAERRGFRVGDEFPLVPPEHEAEARALGYPQTIFRVVGIGIAPGELPPAGARSLAAIHGTAAFFERYAPIAARENRRPGYSLAVRLRAGVTRGDFERAVSGLNVGDQPVQVIWLDDADRSARRALRLQGLALWLLAWLTTAVTTVMLGQTIARHVAIVAEDNEALRALGTSRAQRAAAIVIRGAVAGIAGAAAGSLLAIGSSWFTPVGLARTIEPSPGLLADVTALAVGSAAAATVAIVLTAAHAWRAARSRARWRPARPSIIVSRLAGLGASPSLVSGAQLALEPGRGSAALPVRATELGLLVGVASLAAALVFSASLDRLLATPELQGRRWDLTVTHFGHGPDLLRVRDDLLAIDGVGGLALGGFDELEIGGLPPAGAMGFDGVAGDVLPAVAAGRHPSAPDEIALATRTMSELGLEPGDHVDVNVSEAPPTSLRVVGAVVMPEVAGLRLGHGGLLTLAGLTALEQDGPQKEQFGGAINALIALEPGADRGSVLSALEEGFGLGPWPEAAAADLVGFGRVRELPLVLAGILALFGAATLVHVVLSSVRRRRRDLSILKTLGFVSRQMRGTVGWQALAIALVAAIPGVMLGVAVGRSAWTAFARNLGVIPSPVVPLAAMLALVPLASAVALAVSVPAGRRAAHASPAPAMRTE